MKWYSIKDNLPQIGLVVLVYIKDWEQHDCLFDLAYWTGSKWQREEDNEDLRYNVDYWTELNKP